MPTQSEISRERWIADNYESLIRSGKSADDAAAIVAHNLSTPSFTMPADEIAAIADRVKQRDANA